MPRVRLDSKPVMYSKIGPKAEPGLKTAAYEIGARAEMLLDYHQITGTTDISVEKVPRGTRENRYSADYDVVMSNPDRGAMAIEYGHEPSGRFAGTETRAPRGLYILTRAAGLFGRFKR